MDAPAPPSVVLGAVLVGGRSRRMGADKAVLEVGGRPLAGRAVAALRWAGATEVALIGGDPSWAATVGADRSVPDGWPDTGPVGGLRTALEWAGARGELADGAPGVLLLAAGDQPGLPEALLGRLRHELLRTDAAVVAVRTPDGRSQPFPSVWRLPATDAVARLHHEGERRLHAVLVVAGAGHLAADATAIVDLDLPEDVERWEQRQR